MKVLHINTYDQGGAAIAAIRIHKALLSNDVDSSMLFLHKSNFSIPNSFQFFKSLNNEHIGLKRTLRGFWIRFLFLFSKARSNNLKLKNKQLGFEIFSFNPTDFDITTHSAYKEADIIHLHWTAGFLDYNFFNKNKKPVVWTLHDMNPFTGGCHYSSGCEKYKTECRNCPQLQGTKNPDNSFIDQEYKRLNFKNQNIIITAPSKWLSICAQNSSLFKKFRHKHIAYCLSFSIFDIRSKEFARSLFELDLEKKILLFVSDSIENKRKGFDILLSALKLVDNLNIQICAIGDRNATLIHDKGITFLGKINDERLMALAYSAADAFVLPTREDNLPNVMIESLACGTPVIAFPVGGMLDVIKTGFNGILTQEISSESLAVSITEFIQGKYAFDRIAIRAEAASNFAPSIQAACYSNVYCDLLSNNF